MEYYEINDNGNYGGYFDTSMASNKLIIDIRKSMADFLNAPSWKEILIGPNMTTLTFDMAWTMSKYIKPGDEVLLDRSGHGANIESWRSLEEYGAVIKFIEFNERDCKLNYDMAEKLISNKTKLIAVGLTSNLTGTINDIKRCIKIRFTNTEICNISSLLFKFCYLSKNNKCILGT